MKIAIVGPGAIGCLFAARLTEGGQTVWLFDKDSERARRISAEGIRLDDGGATRRIPARVTTDPRAIGEAEIVCLCVKAYDTLAATRAAQALVGPNSGFVSLQNGLGNAEVVSSVIPSGQIICAVTAHGATSRGCGHVVHAGVGVTTVAPFRPQAGRLSEAFAGVLRQAGFEAELAGEAAGMIWSKLIINAAINPVTAIWNTTNGAILERQELKEQCLAAAREAQSVARALGVPLAYDDAGATVLDVCRRTGANVSSMLQDLRRHKRTEVDAINGAIVREARRLRLNTPVNEHLIRQVQALERSGAGAMEEKP
jgi:2-dehydropantoate 2-reductase